MRAFLFSILDFLSDKIYNEYIKIKRGALMIIGHLNGPRIGMQPQISYTRIGGHIALQPTALENGTVCFDWKTHHATGIELHMTFKKRILLASLTLSLGDGSTVEGAELLDKKGQCVGACRAEKIAYHGFAVSPAFVPDNGIFE